MATKDLMSPATSDKPTVAELREWYDQNKGRIENYAVKEDAIKLLRNINKSTAGRRINAFSKDLVIDYLKNPGRNERGLRNLSRYLYYRSHIYFRVIEFFSNMAMLDARSVIPRHDIQKPKSDTDVLKSFNDTTEILDRMNLTRNMKKVYTTVFREDVFYGVYWLDDTGMIIIPIDPDYAKITGITSYGNYVFDMDMSWFKSRQDILEYWGEPFISLYNRSLEKGQTKWQTIPPEHSICIKFRDDWELVIPPFSGSFISMINLENLADYQAVADEQAIYKLVYQKLKPLKSATDPDDFEVSPDLAIEYFNKFIDEALPDYTSKAIVPGTDDLGIIDFSNNDAATDTSRVLKAQEYTLNLTGGAEVLNGAGINSTAAFKAAMIANTRFALSSILPQTEAWVAMVLDAHINNAAKVHFFMVSPYTKDDFQEDLLQGAQNGLPTALAYNTLNELSERDSLSLLNLQRILGVPDVLTPLSTSYTKSAGSSDTDPTAPGRPNQGDDISESGERSRNE